VGGGVEGQAAERQQLARMLKDYGIFSAGTVRVGEKTGKGHRRASFETSGPGMCLASLARTVTP